MLNNQEASPRKLAWLFPNDSNAQKKYEIIFGIIAPILCIAFDPFVYRPSKDPCFFVSSPLANYTWFFYVSIGLGIFFLTLWIFGRDQIKDCDAFFMGIFFIGMILSLITGITILPYSALGLFFCLGILGFIPFLTAIAYWRNCVWAFQKSIAFKPVRWRINILFFLIGVFVVTGIPALAQYQFAPEPIPPIVCPAE